MNRDGRLIDSIFSMLFFTSGLLAQVTVGPPSLRPAALTAEVPTTVVVTALVASAGKAIITNSVNILQVDQSGNNGHVLGTLNDSGINGDAFAGDGIFGGTITLSQPTPGQIYLLISVAFAGELRRTLSPITAMPVTPPGLPNVPYSPTTSTLIDPHTGLAAVCNELLVSFKQGISQSVIASAISSINGNVAGLLPTISIYQLTIPTCSASALNEAEAALRANAAVASVELDYLPGVSQIITTPNDQYYLQGLQWGLRTINAAEAWSSAAHVPFLTSGATIAVIDTGINTSHEDLAGQIIVGTNWCAQTIGEQCIGQSTDINDDNGHGTMVAGIAAAITNNGMGVASPAYRARIIAEKANVPTTELLFTSAIALAISDATARGARVINISSASNIPSHAMDLAIKDAVAKGVVVVASAGNYGNSTPSFPAAFANVISVAASDQNNSRSMWNVLGVPNSPCDSSQPASNYGTWTTVYAPGSQIFGLLSDVSTGQGAYGYYGGSLSGCAGNGTSFAAPLVSGIVSLMLAVNPDLSPASVKEIIQSTAVYTGNTDPLGDPISVVDAGAAIEHAIGLRPTPATIMVNATLDGINQAGSATVAISGPAIDNGDTLTFGQATYDMTPGSYSLTVNDSSVAGGILSGILPCGVLTRGPTCTFILVPGKVVTVTLQFTSAAARALLVSAGPEVLKFAAGSGLGEGVFSSAGGLITAQAIAATPDGSVYVADSGGGQVLRYSSTGGPEPGQDNSGAVFIPHGSGGLLQPIGIAFGPDGNIYVCDTGAIPFGYTGGAVRKYDGSSGTPLGVFASGGNFNTPSSIVFGPDNNLYVSNDLRGNILRFNRSTGAPLPSAGNGGAVFGKRPVNRTSGHRPTPGIIGE